MNAFNNFTNTNITVPNQQTSVVNNTIKPINIPAMEKQPSYPIYNNLNPVIISIPEELASDYQLAATLQNISEFLWAYVLYHGLKGHNGYVLTGYTDNNNFRIQSASPFVFNGVNNTLILYIENGLLNMVGGPIK